METRGQKRRRGKEDVDDVDGDRLDHQHHRQRQRRRVTGTQEEGGLPQQQAHWNIGQVVLGLVMRLPFFQTVWATLGQRSLSEGTYFDTISDLWETGAVGSFRNMAVVNNALRRPAEIPSGLLHCRHVDKKGVKIGLDPYSNTIQYLGDRSYAPKLTPSRTSHAGPEQKDVVWPVNVFGSTRNGEVAHLLPVGERDASTWWFIAPWLFGKQRNWTWRTLQMAIHGYAKDGNSRVNHTGIKHMVTNKARIPGQFRSMDKNPCLLIIPILQTEQVKEWDGSGYDAIVLIDQWESEDLRTVAEETTMSSVLSSNNTATVDEIEKARELLAFFLRAIFTARKSKRHVPSFRDELYFGNEITIPSACAVQFPIVKKISFVAQTWDSDPNKHPAPDPTLLAARAAVVFSARHNQRLAASAESQQDEHETWTELDQQAAEEYLEWRDAELRYHMNRDLASRLNQQQPLESI